MSTSTAKYAMACASDNHEGVAVALLSKLGLHLREKTCRIFKSATKLRIQQQRQVDGEVVFYYPDPMVVSDPTDNQALFKTRPKVIIEVISHDRGRDLIEKLAVYREIECVEEYLVIGQNPEQPEIHTFRRENDFKADFSQPDVLDVKSLGFTCPLTELYEC